MSRAVLLSLLLAACGRRDFDALADASAPDATARCGTIGCSDGTREGFADVTAFPCVAACAAIWPGTPSLRDPPTGLACGNSLGNCSVPADACAAGWHVCLRDGDPAELRAQLDGDACLSAGGAVSGAFVAASNHCATCAGGCGDVSLCTYGETYGCDGEFGDFCKEPVCCGPGCVGFPQCMSGVWIDRTQIAMRGDPCGALPSTSQTGVLCCAD